MADPFVALAEVSLASSDSLRQIVRHALVARLIHILGKKTAVSSAWR